MMESALIAAAILNVFLTGWMLHLVLRIVDLCQSAIDRTQVLDRTVREVQCNQCEIARITEVDLPYPVNHLQPN